MVVTYRFETLGFLNSALMTVFDTWPEFKRASHAVDYGQLTVSITITDSNFSLPTRLDGIAEITKKPIETRPEPRRRAA